MNIQVQFVADLNWLKGINGDLMMVLYSKEDKKVKNIKKENLKDLKDLKKEINQKENKDSKQQLS